MVIVKSSQGVQNTEEGTLPNIGGTFSVRVTTKDGEVKYDSGDRDMECYCKAFHGFLINLLSNGANVDAWQGGAEGTYPFTVSVQNIAGTSGAVAADNYYVNDGIGSLFIYADDEGNQSSGIILGDGTTPTTASTFNMESVIPHGTDNGQLYYFSSVVYPPILSGNQIIMVTTRTCENKGSAVVNVNEIGLYGKCKSGTYLMMRDIFGESVSVASGDLITIVYKMLFNQNS